MTVAGRHRKTARAALPRGVGALSAMTAGLLALFLLLRSSTWQGSKDLHTPMETVATLLAAIVGTLALARFHTRRNNTILLVGTGFLGTALLDGYHTVVTSRWFNHVWPSPPPHLIPRTLAASGTAPAEAKDR